MLAKKSLITFITAVSIVALGTPAVDAADPIPVYVFAGQSNMVGSSAKAAEVPAHSATLSLPRSNALFWGPTADAPKEWVAIEPPTEIWQSAVRAGFGPEISAAKTLSARHRGRQIAIFKYARNSTNLSTDWDPDNGGGLYKRMMSRLSRARRLLSAKTGRPTRVAGLFWMQGESDAASWAKATSYGRNLKELISTLRADTGQSRLPVVVGQILNISRWYKMYPHSEMVRWKQYEVARSDAHVALVRTDRLRRDVLSPAHFDTKGTIGLGYRMAAAL